MQGSVAREVPESPGRAKKQAKEAKKGRDAGLPAAAARAPKASEYADQLKKVCRSMYTWGLRLQNSREGEMCRWSRVS